MRTKENISRRQFLSSTTALISGAHLVPFVISAPAIAKTFGKPNSRIKGVQIGVITYSYRSMPDQSAEAILNYVVDSGMSAIELMGDPAETFAGKPENPIDRRAYFGLLRKKRNGEVLTDLQEKELSEMRDAMNAYSQEIALWRGKVSMDKFTQLKRMYKKAGVQIYGYKPSAFGEQNSDMEIDYGFRVAKALGASHVTLEHPGNDAHTGKLGMFAAGHNIYVAYHGHTQQTPTFWDTALTQSRYNTLNIDLGHYVAAGNSDALGIVESKHNRIMSMHLKDRQTPGNGKKNMPWGQGDTPIVEVLNLMHKKRYGFPATVELEYEVPEGSDAVAEVAKCFEYCKRALEG